MITELRDYQVEAIDELRDAVRDGHQRVVMQAPTGAGKTLVGAAIIDSALRKSKRVLFVVPALSLIDQTVGVLQGEGVDDVGVMQAMHEMTDGRCKVQVASVQTLSKRQFPECDIIIIDEVHRWFKFYGKMVLDPAHAGKPIIGLSATPWTRGLGSYFTKLLQPVTTQQLIDDGWLSDFKVFAPSSPDLTNVRTVAGDYHEGDLGVVMNEQKLVADVVQTWLEKAQGRPTLCFAVDCAHARALQEQFIKAGVPAEYQDAYTKSEARHLIRHRFHSGDIKVVCNVGTLTTGVDWDVRCIVVARPTKSEMLHVQIIGRGLRTADGKDHCLILDHSDNHIRLGFVTDINHPELDDGRERRAKTKTEDSIALPRPCVGCKALLPPKTKVCPSCGFEHQPRNGAIVCADGELLELDRITRKQKPTIGAREKLILMGRQSVYSQLLHVRLIRGYKPGWAFFKFREIFGDDPSGLNTNHMSPPTPEMKSWIKHKQIEYAKAKEKQPELAL